MENYFKGKNVLVTGGSGFIGSHFLIKLLELGANVITHTHRRELQVRDERIRVVDGIDLLSIDNCNHLLKDVDYVINCAGHVAHPSTVRTDIHTSMSHLNIVSNLLSACEKNGVKKFIDLNSSTGYPDKRESLKEGEYWTGEPHESYFGYGWARRYREKLIEHVSRFSKTEHYIARCTAIFGPYDNFDLKTCHVVPALIKRHLDLENPFIVWGSPDVVRDFLYVKDVVDGVLLILEKGQPMTPYNLGYGDGITIGEIVDTIIKITGYNPEVTYDNTKPTTIPFRAVNVDKIKNELGFKPKYTFDEGIKETIKWYIDKKMEGKRI
jgi:GDP-L-fucose synthase